MKKRVPEIILGACLAIAVFALGVAFHNTPLPNPSFTHSTLAETSGSEFWNAKFTDWLMVLFTLVIGVFTAGLCWSTWKLWKVTNATLDHARQSNEDQLRPYVQVVNATFEWRGAAVRIIAECLNSGQSPATFFEVGCISDVGAPLMGMSKEIPSDLEYNVWSPIGVGRSELAELRSGLSSEHAREVLTPKSDKYFRVRGRIKYGDIFKNEYETEFIFFCRDVKPNTQIKMSRSSGRLSTFRKLEKPPTTATEPGVSSARTDR